MDEQYIYCKETSDNFKLHNIKKEDVKIVDKIKVKELIHIYKQMVVIRHMDELMDAEYKKGNVRGFCHLSIGQEGIYAALEKAMKNDVVTASYRCHGVAYVTGCSIVEIIGELLGKQMGVCKGKGGSMHLYNRNFFGGHGIVAAQVSLGLGIAYALKYRNIHESREDLRNQRVCYIFYGDGAANQGQVWESFNMAKIWKLPVVFVCENNRYGMWTPVESVSADTDFYLRGGTIPGIRVGHKDIFGLLSVFEHGRKYALEEGPIIIQVDTYRLCGHSSVDNAEIYRSKEEVEMEKKNDCMSDVENRLVSFLSEEALNDVRDEACKQVENDFETAKGSKSTNKEELFKDITTQC